MALVGPRPISDAVVDAAHIRELVAQLNKAANAAREHFSVRFVLGPHDGFGEIQVYMSKTL